MATKMLRIGLLGCGTVGRGLVELVSRNHALIRQRAGVELRITNILVRDLKKNRPGVDCSLLTVQPEKVINNGCDLVVELLGGIEPARTFIQRALAVRKPVVTANKALLAADGYSLMKAAEIQKVRLGFEASVCGAIPIVRALTAGLVGNHIASLTGILNGTCNYILSRMSEEGLDFNQALAEAQAKGFAEADPTLDLDGHDAAQKLKILAELAFHARLASNAVQVEGIRDISTDDIQAARELRYVIKHVAIAERVDGAVTLSVRPMLLPISHQLAGVNDENNAVLVRGDAVGEMLFSGKGAGSLPSASAVLSDVVEIARHKGAFSLVPSHTLRVVAEPNEGRHYLRFPVEETSAIGVITSTLEKSGIAVARAAATWAKNQSSRNQIRVLTQVCTRSALEKALGAVSSLGVLKGKSVVLRVVG